MSMRPDRVILVYDGDGGLHAMLLDALKKAVGREECPLCEITYSPTGKRREWLAGEKRLGVRPQLAWNVRATVGGKPQFVLATAPMTAVLRSSGDVRASSRHAIPSHRTRHQSPG